MTAGNILADLGRSGGSGAVWIRSGRGVGIEAAGPAGFLCRCGLPSGRDGRRADLRNSKALKAAGLTLDQIDLIELNEAFAAQVLAVIRELGINSEKVNVNGGAIALGHPLGCTGAKLTTTLLGEMERCKARYGMVTMCVGGGMGAAGIFERLG